MNLRMQAYVWGQEVLEFIATGTAVRSLTGSGAHRAPDGRVVEVPALVIGMSYRKAKRTMDDYRSVPFSVEYRVLGLSGNESPDEVRRQWRGLAARLHDRRTNDLPEAREAAQERLKYVNAAYAVSRRNGLAE